MAGVKVTRHDRGLKALMERVKALGKLRVTVGVQGDDASERYPDGTPVSTVARAMERGTADTPKRPYARRALDRGAQATERAAVAGLTGVASRGDNPVDGLARAGEALAEAERDAIAEASSWARPLAASTVERKGHSRPLQDTGLLERSVSWAVREGNRVRDSGKP